nr:hypothetical protein [Tanacetum cinerariifolium]
GLTDRKSASKPIDTEKPLLKDHDGEDVDVHIYRSMIGSLTYLTSSRPDIVFAVCACAHFQVTPKALQLYTVKRIFRYLKGKPHLGLWYPKDSPFDLVAYSDSDYAGASLDKKSTSGGCQFLRCILISWQCKKQTVVATSSTEAEYVAAASCCAQVLWIHNQLLNYGLKKLELELVLLTYKFLLLGYVIAVSSKVFAIWSDKLVLLGDLSTHTTKYTSPALTQKVFANMRRVCKGFFGVDIPLFEGMLVAQVVEERDVDENEQNVNAGDAAEGDVSPANAEVPTIDEEPSIPYPTPPTPPPKPFSAATLTAAPARVIAAPSRRRKGVVIRDPQEESTTSAIIPTETKSKDKGKGILVEEPKPLKKQQQIKQDEKYARELKAELNKNINWDEVIDHVKKKAKEDPTMKKYQALKRKPQTEAQARKNIMVYLKNVACFKMDYFKGMSYDDIRPIFEAKFSTNVAFLLKTKEQIEEEESRALKRLNETPAKKAAKRQKLDEEVEELKRHL